MKCLSFLLVPILLVLVSCQSESLGFEEELELELVALDKAYPQIDIKALRPTFPLPLNEDFLVQLETELLFFYGENSEPNTSEVTDILLSQNSNARSRSNCNDPTMIFVPVECLDEVIIVYGPDGPESIEFILDFDSGNLVGVQSNGALGGWIWDNFTQTNWSLFTGSVDESIVVIINGFHSSGPDGRECHGYFTVTYNPTSGNSTAIWSGC